MTSVSQVWKSFAVYPMAGKSPFASKELPPVPVPLPWSTPVVWLITASVMTPTPAALQVATMDLNSCSVPSLEFKL